VVNLVVASEEACINQVLFSAAIQQQRFRSNPAGILQHQRQQRHPSRRSA
jgi:hypothetical protein